MRVISIDIDGTALNYPEKVNNLYLKKDTFIVLNTSRPEFMRSLTVDELAKKNIKYNALVMDKLKADFYIDDKNANFNLEHYDLS